MAPALHNEFNSNFLGVAKSLFLKDGVIVIFNKVNHNGAKNRGYFKSCKKSLMVISLVINP